MDDNTLEGLLRQYINNSIAGMFTAIPARITQVVNAGEQRVDVQPIVSRVTTDDVVRDHPVILSVPLIYPGSSTSQFSFPVNVGDTVLLVFSQRSIDRFKQGAESPHRALSFRKYSRQDAMAIPGLYSFPSSANQPSRRNLSHDTSDTVVSHNIGAGQECEVRLKSNGDVIINSPGQITVNADTAEVNATNTTVNGDFNVNGNVAFDGGTVEHNGTDIGETHTHSGVTSGSSSTGPVN